jgi:hypothetical protein
LEAFGAVPRLTFLPLEMAESYYITMVIPGVIYPVVRPILLEAFGAVPHLTSSPQVPEAPSYIMMANNGVLCPVALRTPL